jgi:phage terminase large subunit-like protein
MPDRREQAQTVLRDAGFDPAEWMVRPSDVTAVLDGCLPDVSAAEKVRGFCSEFLRQSKGEWSGQSLDLLPWQWDQVVKPLYAWKRQDGYRRFRVGYFSMPKKNGKSTLMAGLANYSLVADGEPGAEIYIAAADRDQAGIIFEEAANMVQASPYLYTHVEIVRSRKRLVFTQTGSILQALSAEVPKKEGLNANVVIFDELHAQKTREMYDTLRGAGSSRRQPLFLMITTAGWDRNSICHEVYQYAKNVEAGVIDDTAFLSFISEAGPDEDWKSPEVLKRVNVSYGTTITDGALTDRFNEACASLRGQNAFRRYHLNQWVEQETRFIDLDRWDECGDVIDEESLRGRPCIMGVDLSATTDLTAVVLLFHEDDNAVLPFLFAPQVGAAKRQRKDQAPYVQWSNDGFLELTPGEIVATDHIKERILVLAGKYDVKEVAIDPWNGIALQTALIDEGLEVVAFRQGYASMSAPTKELEKLILSRSLRHGNHPVMRWMMSNLAVEMDPAGNLKPSKSKSGDRIDGVVSLIMAIGRRMATSSGASVYDADDALVWV